MDWINKHRGIVVVVVLIIFCWPVIVNWLYNVETDCKVLHKPQEWTMFWGSYIGSIVSAAVAFIILHLQRKDNSKENESNRKLQLKILEHQQEMQWLNTFRQVSAEYIIAYSYDNIRLIINIVRYNPEEAFFLIKPLIERINKARILADVVKIGEKDSNLKDNLCKNHNFYADTLSDMNFLLTWFMQEGNLHSFCELENSEEYRNMTKVMKDIIIKECIDKINKTYGNSTNYQIDDLIKQSILIYKSNLFKILSDRGSILMRDVQEIKIEELLSDYIYSEQDRIEQILKQDTK